MKFNHEHFRSNMKKLRRHHRVPLKDLAKCLGVSHQAVSAMERGTIGLSLNNGAIIALVLNMDLRRYVIEEAK